MLGTKSVMKKENLEGKDLRAKRKHCSSKDGDGFGKIGVFIHEFLEERVGILQKQDKEKQLEKKPREDSRKTMKSGNNNSHEEDKEEAEDMPRLCRLLRNSEGQELKTQQNGNNQTGCQKKSTPKQ